MKFRNIIIILLSSILFCVVYFIFSNNKKVEREQDDAIMIGEYLLKELKDGSYDLERYYFLDDHKENNIFLNNEYIKELIDDYSYELVIFLDNQSVMITEGAYFQAIDGYLITYKDSLPSNLHVSSLNFDGDQIHIEKIKDHLYNWNAGL